MTRLLMMPIAALLAAAPAATSAHHPAMLKWMDAPPSLPSGAKMAVVSGDPTKTGMFKMDVKLPAGYAVPPHWHPTNERVKVLSGYLHYGMNDKVMSNAKTLKLHQSVLMKAKMHHWVHAAEPATIEVSGMGPFEINYIDPKDDPRKK